MVDGDLAGPLPDSILHTNGIVQVDARRGRALTQLLHSALEAHHPTVLARARPHINHMIRDRNGFRLMLHDEHRVSLVP